VRPSPRSLRFHFPKTFLALAIAQARRLRPPFSLFAPSSPVGHPLHSPLQPDLPPRHDILFRIVEVGTARPNADCSHAMTLSGMRAESTVGLICVFIFFNFPLEAGRSLTVCDGFSSIRCTPSHPTFPRGGLSRLRVLSPPSIRRPRARQAGLFRNPSLVIARAAFLIGISSPGSYWAWTFFLATPLWKSS